MKPTVLAIFLSSILFLLPAPSASAHHSMSGYDRARTVSVRATITNFSWENPHVETFFEVSQESGPTVRWMAEMPGPARLERNGWSKDSLKAGDQVTIYGNPASDGSPTMRLVKVVTADGKELISYK